MGQPLPKPRQTLRGAGRSSAPASPLVTFHQAAAEAANSPQWWRRLARRGEIDVIHLGRSARLRRSDVDRILASGRSADHGAQSRAGGEATR